MQGNSEFILEPARFSDVNDLISLFYMKRPTAWIKRISRQGLIKFLKYSIENPRCIVLMARSDAGAAGYIFSTIDTSRFWLGFALRHPVLMLKIQLYRFERKKELDEQAASEDNPELPAFSWSPNGPHHARIMGILVHEKYRGHGIAKKLYLKLFGMLKNRGCRIVEEYMGPDYCDFVGKYHDCGWQLMQVKGAGYKITKELQN